jgi:phage tail sheath protein FI
MEFEPNDTRLWARIRRQVNDYLFKLFTAGALRGATPQDAYFVHCDGTTTSLADREAGRVIVDIGLAPVRPARFIVVRVVHDAGGLRPVAPDAA